jgi:chromosome segregation ATPase
MNPFTPEQNVQLTSWASERDSILSEISVKRDELKNLTKQNENLAQSNTDLTDRINQSIGRLRELDKKEKELQVMVSSEVSVLFMQKSALQSEVTAITRQVEMLETQKNVLTHDITTFKDVYDRVVDRTAALDNIMNHVVAITDENIRKVDILMGNLAGSIQKVLDVNEANVNKANMVIMEMPKMFFELQKHQPLKKPIII